MCFSPCSHPSLTIPGAMLPMDTGWEKRRSKEQVGWGGRRDKAKGPTNARWVQGNDGERRKWARTCSAD